MTKRWKLITTVGLMAGLVLGTGARSIADTERVRMQDSFFQPKRKVIQKGDRVRWVNKGNLRHTTTSTQGKWNSGRLAPGEDFTRRFRRRGEFPYKCNLHAGIGMRGKIVVT
jgi:plastocyanin